MVQNWWLKTFWNWITGGQKHTSSLLPVPQAYELFQYSPLLGTSKITLVYIFSSILNHD